MVGRWSMIRAAVGVSLGLGAVVGCSNRALQFDSGAEGDSEGTGGATDGRDPPGPLPPGSGPMMTTTPPPEPPGPMTTAPPPTTSPPDPGDPTAPDPTFTSITVTESDTGMPVDPMPPGEACTEDEECESGQCYDAGILGGSCGECNEDADCPGGGCSPPNPIEGIPAVCNDGSPGDGCETDEACEAPFLCAEILDIPGVLTSSACSECNSDDHCVGEACNPFIDLLEFGGVKICVPLGSVPFGETCDHEGSGNFACQSGRCAPADVTGLVEIGVCSQCISDRDCFGGTCIPPQIDFGTGETTPGVCE